jgi:hypothetical protein
MISCDEFVHPAIPKQGSNVILDSVGGLEVWSLRDIFYSTLVLAMGVSSRKTDISTQSGYLYLGHSSCRSLTQAVLCGLSSPW